MNSDTNYDSKFDTNFDKFSKGAVVTRDRAQSADIWRMNDTTYFLVETNYDHWKNPLFIDDRITPANKCMNQTGQAVRKI